MSMYAVCFSVIKSCTYWDSSTQQAFHEHACLFYEKCSVDPVGKMPSNITIYANFVSVNTLLKHTPLAVITLKKLTTTSSFLMHFLAFLLHELIQSKY